MAVLAMEGQTLPAEDEDEEGPRTNGQGEEEVEL